MKAYGSFPPPNERRDAETEKVEIEEQNEWPPFDINLIVILAGFASEAYRSPHENVGRYEVDAAGCKTMFLSESFVREICVIKLKKGINLPAMDLWVVVECENLMGLILNVESDDEVDSVGVKAALVVLTFYKSGFGFDPP
ncbi:hypothetical protein Ddye_021724 [Dipteronia dyeriana]|uniref:Uncharacterized protein n=1 Tax=Dipteronia dyeriana TaxID=168575 RepID=A0AAD9WWJ0_9ROSI|nr:hypothetical protein Ddye_021724 [Dipteronia dyeriana]